MTNTINIEDIKLTDAERQPCEIWTRVMGYHRPVSEFNKGKKSEYYVANVAKVDAGAKGILIAFRNNTFAAADKLIDMVTKSFGVLQIRPDQKLFVSKDLSQYSERIAVLKNVISKLKDLLFLVRTAANLI